MTVRPCDINVTGCPCINDDPFANFSSEAPDPFSTLRMSWQAADPPINSPDNYYSNLIGVGVCTDADPQTAQDCSGGAAYRETHPGQPTFTSKATSCSVSCPSGGSFSYSLPAGVITAATQALADYLAQSICFYRATLARRCAPVVVTKDATDVEATSVTLNGSVNPNGAETTVFFQWGPTTAYGKVTPITSVGDGITTLDFSAALTGLIAGTTYHYRIVAVSAQGTAIGTDKTFLKLAVIIFDFSTFKDLTEAGVVCGSDTTGQAAIVDPDDGTITQISLGGFGGECRCGNVSLQYGGTSDNGANFDAFWNDSDPVPPALPVLLDLGSGSVFSIAEDGFAAVQLFPGATLSYLYDPILNLFTYLGTLGGTDTYIGGVGLFDGPNLNNRCINLSHQIACSSKLATTVPHAARWSAGVLTDLNPLFAAPGQPSCSVGIDANGAVLGNYHLGGLVRAFINQGGGAAFSLDIGTFGGYVYPISLSKENLYATGYARFAGTDRAFIWKNGSAIALIPLLVGETFSYPADVNSDGWVVGISDNYTWLYRRSLGTTVDLLTLFPAGSGWTVLFTAELVNDSHQIVGTGIHAGVPKSFLLTLP